MMPFYTKPPCMCLLDFVCNACKAKEANRLEGYGYTKSDNDGWDGGFVTPEEHKSEEFLVAAEMLLDAKPILEKP